MLGVLGLAAVLWLSTLNGHIQDQARAIKELRETVAETSDRQRVALDAALGGRAGKDHEKFVEQLRPRHPRARRRPGPGSPTRRSPTDLLAAKVKQLTDDYGEAPGEVRRGQHVREGGQGGRRTPRRGRRTPGDRREAGPAGSPTSKTCSTPTRAARPPPWPRRRRTPGTPPSAAGPSASLLALALAADYAFRQPPGATAARTTQPPTNLARAPDRHEIGWIAARDPDPQAEPDSGRPSLPGRPIRVGRVQDMTCRNFGTLML